MQQTEWDISFMPKLGSKEYVSLIASLKEKTKTFSLYREKLEHMTPQLFSQMYDLREEISFQVMKLQVQAYLLTSKNLADDAAKLALQKAEDLASQVSNDMRFFSQWFIRLSKKQAQEFANLTKSDSYSLMHMHELGKHILSEKEENIISTKSTTGSSAICAMYDAISANWEFSFDNKTLSYTQMRNYAFHPNRELRKGAYQQILQKYEYHADMFFDMYVALTKDHINEITLRGYSKTQQPRLLSEGFSEKALAALLQAVKSHTSLFHELFALKAKLLKLPKMELYDVYAPIGEEGKMSYAQAMQDIMASLESYPAFGKHVTTLYDAKRLDTVFHPKKRAGAYNYGLPHNLMPFVFMQYLGKERDASTLAHELGHAVHAMYTKELTTNSYHSSIGIAESASTFFEELLFTQQLNKAPATQKISLLINHLTDSFSTIIRQAYINEFELQAHAKVEEGTTKSELHALWASLQKEQFGEAVTIPESSLSWTYVPHIYHTPFYCYNYALGNLLALMLVGSDQKKLEQYLSVGGTMDTLQTAKLMNIDLEDPQVYERAFAKLKERIDLLKSLVR